MTSNGDGASQSVNTAPARKRIETKSTSLKRAMEGNAYTKCECCSKDVPVALLSVHDYELEARLKNNIETQILRGVMEAKMGMGLENDPSTTVEKSAKKGKKEKDPNKPKKTPSAFLMFMADFRKILKIENPEARRVSIISKQGGDRWKTLTDEEKKPYYDKAAELKEEQKKALESQNDSEIGAADAEGEENDADPSEKGEKVPDDE